MRAFVALVGVDLQTHLWVLILRELSVTLVGADSRKHLVALNWKELSQHLLVLFSRKLFVRTYSTVYQGMDLTPREGISHRHHLLTRSGAGVNGLNSTSQSH